MILVFISGEGRNELGSWFGLKKFQSDEVPGVIKALLSKVKTSGWQITGACAWKEIRKLKAGFHGKAEERNVLGVVLKAKEEGCQVVAFVRDRNDCIQRELDVENGIEKAKNVFLKGPRIIGGVAIKKLESWIVALSGRKKSETLERPEDYLRGIGIGIKDTQGMVNIVDYSRMDEIPDDAMSLKKWLDQAQFVLNDETLVEAK